MAKKNNETTTHSERRNFVTLAFPTLLGLLAACGKSMQFGSNTRDLPTKTLKMEDANSAVADAAPVTLNPSPSPVAEIGSGSETTLIEVPSFTIEPTPGVPTVTPAPTETPVAAVETPVAVATVNPLSEFEKLKIPVAVTDLIKRVKMYGSPSVAMIGLELNNAVAGDFVHIVRKSTADDTVGTVLSTKKISLADTKTPIVFDNLRLQGAYSVEVVYQKACGTMKSQNMATDSSAFTSNRYNETIGETVPVIDALKLMDAPYPGYFENMPHVLTTNPSEAKGVGTQSSVVGRAYNVATTKSKWPETKFEAADGKPRVYEFTDALGNSISPASDPQFFLNNNLLVVYYFNKTHYYRYFYFFG